MKREHWLLIVGAFLCVIGLLFGVLGAYCVIKIQTLFAQNSGLFTRAMADNQLLFAVYFVFLCTIMEIAGCVSIVFGIKQMKNS